MRRLGVLLALCLGLLLAATSGAIGARHDQAVADTLTPLPAVQADSVVDSYGVGIHLNFLNTPYADATAVANALSNLGVRHVRDDMQVDNPRFDAGVATVANKGIKFNLIMGNPTSPDSPATYVNDVASQLPAGSVESLEGSNEWDLNGTANWVQELLTRQQALYQAAKANPATANLPVLAPALAFKWNYAALGDISPYADYANAHMYPGGYKPSNEVSQITTALRGAVPSKPLITTEAGYHNALNTTNGHLPVPEDVAGVYTPRILLEHILHGDKRVYTYELLDEFDDPALTNPEAHFGLMHRDFSPKPAYTAMQNLLSLVNDPGPSFTPAALPIKVSGFPSDGKYLITQKRNGQYVVFLWRDVQIYDPVLKMPTPVTPTNVTMQLSKTENINVYRPSEGSSPVSTTQASSIPLSMDGSVTAVTIDNIPAPAPTNVTATAGNASAQVSWSLPSTNANVTGFEVTRSPGTTTTLPATARSFSDTGLTNGTAYTYAVRALSPDGNSATVSAPAVTPTAPATAPGVPTITSTTAGSGSVTVAWKAPASNGGSPITAYQLISGSKTLTVSPSTLKATLSGLAKNTKTRVGVRAQNAVGWGNQAFTPYVTTKAAAKK